jgi:hypothetical protein
MIVTYNLKSGSDSQRQTEVDTAFQEIKEPLINDRTSSWIALRNYSGSFLPPRVVAKLEFNSVIPPPDTIEEEIKK